MVLFKKKIYKKVNNRFADENFKTYEKGEYFLSVVDTSIQEYFFKKSNRQSRSSGIKLLQNVNAA